MTPTKYIANKDKRTYSPFIVKGGERFYMESDESYTLIPEKEFYEKYPLSEKVRPESKRLDKGENPDKTKV